jgi:hypothetical protein
MRTWSEKILAQMPSLETVRDLFESVATVPGLERWEPSEGHLLQWLDIVHWGWIVSQTQGLRNVDQLYRQFGKEILAHGRPAVGTLAELSAAALCAHLGAIGGWRIPRSDRRTADWRLSWPIDSLVDVEVTVAAEKPKHLEYQRIADNLADALFQLGHEFDLVAHMANPSSEADRAAIIEAATQIGVGAQAEHVGRWRLSAEAISRNVTILLEAPRDDRPSWWSRDDAMRFVLKQRVAGPTTERAPPQVRVGFGVPYQSYINSVERKARLPQGDPAFPFLIVLDVGNLPGALREIPRVVLPFLPKWQVVSGVLLFFDLRSFDRIGWTWRLLANPYANRPLPDSLSLGRADLAGSMDTYRRTA